MGTVEVEVWSGAELTPWLESVVLELVMIAEELVRLLAELVELVMMVVVELATVAGALPNIIPCSIKYWAVGSVPMMSSPKNPKPTTVPFLN